MSTQEPCNNIENVKPREWFCLKANQFNPVGAWDFKPNWIDENDLFHVIEKSAFDAVVKECDELKAKLEEAVRTLRDISQTKFDRFHKASYWTLVDMADVALDKIRGEG